MFLWFLSFYFRKTVFCLVIFREGDWGFYRCLRVDSRGCGGAVVVFDVRFL